MGRSNWLNRDPIKELGGKNLYAFSKNRVVNTIDRFGLASGFWNRTKEVVGGVVNLGPFDAYDAANGDTANTAREIGREFGNQASAEDASNVTNAARHAAWQARLTQLHGADAAETVGNLHELGESTVSEARAADSAKDLHNNEVGRQIGESLGPDATWDDIRDAVGEALENGELAVDNPEGVVTAEDSSSSRDSSEGQDSSGGEYDSSGRGGQCQ